MGTLANYAQIHIPVNQSINLSFHDPSSSNMGMSHDLQRLTVTLSDEQLGPMFICFSGVKRSSFFCFITSVTKNGNCSHRDLNDLNSLEQ